MNPLPAVIVLTLFLIALAGYAGHAVVGDIIDGGVRGLRGFLSLRGSTLTATVIVMVLLIRPWPHGAPAALAFRFLLIGSGTAGALTAVLFPQIRHRPDRW